MSKYITLQPRKFLVEFRDWHQASVHGGQLAVTALLEEFGLHIAPAAAVGRNGKSEWERAPGFLSRLSRGHCCRRIGCTSAQRLPLRR